MPQYVPCRSCTKPVNRFLEVCPYCGADPGGDRRDVSELAPSLRPPGERVEKPFAPVTSVALFLQLLFGLFVIGSIVTLIVGSAYRTALLDLASGGPLRAEAVLAEERYIAAVSVLGVVNIVLAVVWIVWFWRAYSNLGILGRVRSRKPGWAIGSWFIPIGNIFIPYGIGAEIWTQSAPQAGSVTVRRDPNMEPVISWWALFLIMAVVNQIALFSGSDVGDDPGRIATIVGLDMIGSAIAIAAAVAAARFVRLATARQDALAELAIVAPPETPARVPRGPRDR